LDITSSKDININSNQINIGTNQGAAALNNIYIGNLTSGSIIYLNGIVYSPYAFNLTGSVLQW
jgi:hypothetical protein